jgi:hypothetical protein
VTAPAAVRAAWGWDDDHAVEPLSGGLINATYAVRRGGAPIAVVQRLHPIFAGEVNLDLEHVTAHLARAGLTTPRLLRTRRGDAWITDDDRVWRALTWVDGVAHHAVTSTALAAAGGELVGRFHRAVAELSYDYAFARAGVHDTPAHLARLRERVEGGAVAEAVELGHDVLAAAAALPPLPPLPRAPCARGSQVLEHPLFARGPRLVPGRPRHPRAYGLGPRDGRRAALVVQPRGGGQHRGGSTWPSSPPRWARGATSSAMGSTSPSCGDRRRARDGVRRLAARFTTDAFDDRYFGWDPARFPSRRAHNLVRARGQLALARAVRAARADALAVVGA